MKPWLILVTVLLWLASLVAVGVWQSKDGRDAERVVWQTRENEELRLANAKIIELNETARNAERKHAEQVAGLSARYEKEKADVGKTKDTIIAELRAGQRSLRDPGAAGLKTAGGGAGKTHAAAGQCDGGARSQLSQQTSEFLVSLASEADAVVKQLSACQDVIRADRAMAGPSP
jgi:prophage endopeptidase